MHYLVTGGAGFIGSRIAAALIKQGFAVSIIDNLKTGLRENIPAEANFFEGDIADARFLASLPERNYQAVLHLAAQSSGEISHDDPDYDLNSNARGTLNILRWCESRGIDRVLNASSMGVYGQVTPDMCPIPETQQPKPLSFYGVSKFSAENYCHYFISRGMKITSFRMFNVYGPGQNLSNLKQGMVSIYLAYLMRHEPLIVKGSKYRFRDFIYVDDVVNAWLAAIDRPETFGKVYNLGTGRKTYVHELINSLLQAFDYNAATYPVEYASETPADQNGIYADISEVRKDLAWTPAVDIGHGIRSLVTYYKKGSATHEGY